MTSTVKDSHLAKRSSARVWESRVITTDNTLLPRYQFLCFTFMFYLLSCYLCSYYIFFRPRQCRLSISKQASLQYQSGGLIVLDLCFLVYHIYYLLYHSILYGTRGFLRIAMRILTSAHSTSCAVRLPCPSSSILLHLLLLLLLLLQCRRHTAPGTASSCVEKVSIS